MSATETSSKMLEQFFHNIRQTTEANLKLQQEAVRQLSSLWPVSVPQSAYADALRDFQKKWSSVVMDLAKKHREVVDQQYQAAIENLEAALNMSEATTPEEYRRRSEQLCRKTLDCMRDLSESQIQEFQQAVHKLTELVTKSQS